MLIGKPVKPAAIIAASISAQPRRWITIPPQPSCSPVDVDHDLAAIGSAVARRQRSRPIA